MRIAEKTGVPVRISPSWVRARVCRFGGEGLAEGVFVAAAGLSAAGLGAAAGLLFLLEGRVVGQPFDAGGHETAGGGAAFGHCALALRHELYAHGSELLLEVEVLLLRHALRVQRVAEGAQAVQPDGLALAHVVGHHARQFAKDGHHVGVGDGTHLAQPLGHLLHGYGLAHHDGLRIPHAVLLIENFLVETHTK